MKIRLAITTLFATAMLAGTGHATEYVTNGDFSSLTNGLGQLGYNTDATGWATNGYNFVLNVADVGSSGSYGLTTYWDAANGGSSSWDGKSPTGGNFVAMDGDFGTSPVTQTITGLTAGKNYTLSFNYAFGQQKNYTGETTQHLTASLGSDAITTADFVVPSKGFTGWQTYTGNFTADGTSDVLSFLAYGNVPVPPFAMLTNVSLIGAVPEPATWGMMILGLGAMGVVARRRRQRVLAAA